MNHSRVSTLKFNALRFCLGLMLPLLGWAGDSDGFRPLFNGVDLKGWDGNPKLWSVVDGVIVGQTTAAGKLAYNEFLIWTGGPVTDFELRFKMRQTGNNSGVQYRSREHPEVGRWVVGGYQCDIHPIPQNNGQLYEERGRKLIGRNGHSVVIDPRGEKWLVEELGLVTTNATAWNEYSILARGNYIEHRINGRTVFKLWDFQADARALLGLLALQIHQGPPMRVEVSEILLKTLPRAESKPFDGSLIPKGATRVPMP